MSGNQSPLQNPFAALDIQGRPDVPVASLEATPEKKKRHRIILRREKSQRGGKTVVVVSQLPTHLSPPELENLAKAARKALGCGGHVVGREIEIQGDQADRVRAYFEKEGFQVGGV